MAQVTGRGIVLMGVSGCGKTTVGQTLAAQLDCPFYDGDHYHPAENVAKMAAGTPLTDTDRWPWLARLRDLMAAHQQRGETAVLACSALKKTYRDYLRAGNDGLCFVHLQGDFDLIWQRMQARQEHYMKAPMLRSQFAALEPPTSAEALIIDVDDDVTHIVNQIVMAWPDCKK